MASFVRARRPKCWEPEAKRPTWWESDQGWRDFAQLVCARLRQGDADPEDTYLRLSGDEAGELVDHLAVEYAIYFQVMRVLRPTRHYWDEGLIERVAGDVWSHFAETLTRGIPYRHHNEWMLASWVHIRAYYAARQALRTELPKGEVLPPNELDLFFSDAPEDDERMDLAERLEALLEATLQLPWRQREVVRGRLNGESNWSIAKRLKISGPTASRAYRHALETLYGILAARFGRSA